jgi:lysophospholipase L1-like esterase
MGSFRRLFLVAVAVAMSFSGYVLSGQSVQSNAPVYLALGDSYPFGSRCETTPCTQPDSPTTLETAKNDNFYVGYPDYLQVMIDRPLINAACPGESTSSFITLDAPTGLACSQVRALGLLHIEYAGSQMEFAEDYLRTHDRVQLVTLQLGGPQTGRFFEDCQLNPTCILNGLPAHTARLVADLTTILSRLRGTGYSGQIIFVEYPSTNYNGFLAQIPPQLYQAILPVLVANGAQKAPVYDAFKAAATPFGGNSCATGLLITNANGTCNVHPTAAGHQLIASIIAGMVPPRSDE